MTAKQNRPGGRSQAAAEAFHGAEPIVPDLADLDALAAHLKGTFVVVVERRDGDLHRIVRRPYLTAAAAERAARNAVERGQSASVYLAELRPLWLITGLGVVR